MAEYKIIEEKKTEMLNKQFKNRIPLFFICILVAISISIFQLNSLNVLERNFKIIILIILFTLIFAGIAIYIGIKFGSKIYKENNIDIIYKIDNGVFSILKKGNIYIEIKENDLEKIEQYKDQSIKIVLKNKHQIILNNNIENYENLVSELKSIFKIEYIEKSKMNLLYKLSAIPMVILMGLFYININKMATIISGVIIIIFLLFSAIKIFFDKYADKRLKFCMLVVLIVAYDIIKRILEI